MQLSTPKARPRSRRRPIAGARDRRHAQCLPLCTPLGACLAFKGVANTIPFLHGSQGCSTYIRRYLISHYREPVDIAASNFSEDSAVFGGGANLQAGLKNVDSQYHPGTHRRGHDLPERNHRRGHAGLAGRLPRGAARPAADRACFDPELPRFACRGFHLAVKAMVAQLAAPHAAHGGINLLPGMVSPGRPAPLAGIGRGVPSGADHPARL